VVKAAVAFSNVGLTSGPSTTAASATVPSGSIISQSPLAGALVTPGTPVSIVVSSGPPPVPVP
jgi:eukaryotic-like serine/threonine-protein kinase